MQKKDLEPSVGKVMLLDLVSGIQITTQIESVDDSQVHCKRPIIFQITVQPVDPSLPPSPANPPQQTMQGIPYGGPFTHPRQDVSFDLAHVLSAHDPIDAIDKAYMQVTSGIQLAGADALGQLDSKLKIVK